MKNNKLLFNNSTVLITGATGSFGRSMVKHLLKNYKLKKIIIFSRDELKQFNMSNEIIDKKKTLRFFIGDVRDKERLDLAMKNVDYVFHAAALKQVPIAEYNPIEAIKTNIDGAQNVILSSIENNVKKVVALSTDKAVNPINLYGATKLAADKLFIAANNLSGKEGTKFSVVRYGNVLGSRGSVIPFFKSLKEKKINNIPITDRDMTRFFISIEGAVEFVIKSFKRMYGGEIFVPKIPSVKIIDLAKAIIPNCKYKIVGIRPGEKVHETLVSREESFNTTEYKDFFLVLPIIDIRDINKIKKNIYKYKAKKVKNYFEYSSLNNKKYLNINDLKSLLKKLNVS